MNEIRKPLLPAKAGYVEVIDEQGNHVYKPTPETEEKLKRDKELEEIRSDVKTTLGETDDGSKEALELRKAIQLFAADISDESKMLAIPTIYPEYQVGKAYQANDVFRYGTNSVGDPQLYQVLQAHTSAAEWTPDTAVSLYKKIGISEDGTPLWVQPLGATDAYNTGDRVMYKSQKYESLIDANVWAPDVYPAGWKLVTDTEEPEPEPEPEPDPGEDEDVPDYVQPTGAHDAYNTGDRVKFTDGHVYESLIDNNVWSPTAYPAGWKLIE